ncbi:uncharacterized protein LOC128225547 [Mya arenaria]|uniref:uncharacterized protein LOC128225547 n=1 Tax=Mya arenaria TaxID=6604 RepID=UPI0022E0B933|nr:uncharacterized protein LOC128225547 [Mya arenaria]
MYGREDFQKWVDFSMDKCDLHDIRLEVHCDDHQEICCHVCVDRNHRQCRSISHLSDLARGFLKTAEFKQLPVKVDKMMSRLDELKNAKMEDQDSLKDCHKNILTEIKDFRKEINDILDQLEKKTVKLLDSMIKDLEKSVKDDIQSCAHVSDKLETTMRRVELMSEKLMHTRSYIGYRRLKNQLTQAERLVHELEVAPREELVFHPNSKVITILRSLRTIGKFHGSKQFSVKVQGDRVSCHITAICETTNGHIVIIDHNNKRVKLLNSEFRVTAHCSLPGNPQHMCHTSGNEVAVAVDAYDLHEVHFLKVSRENIQKVRKFTTVDNCISVAHHQNELYVGSHTGVYQYTINGQLIKKILSANWKVMKCAISPDGERIYVTDYFKGNLLTFDKCGKLLSTLEDRELSRPSGICVSPRGDVFVCVWRDSCTVLQVDREGRQKLATVARQADRSFVPRSVCFSKQTSSLIVGGYGRGNIICFGSCAEP